MDVYFNLVHWLGNNFISGLFISILTIIVFHLFLKEKAHTKRAAIIVSWIIIVYCFLALISQVFLFVAPPSEEYRVWERATGPYWLAYWIKIVSHTILPLILMLIKSRRNLYFLFSLSIIINLGWLIESFIMHMINFHRDYIPEKMDYDLFLPFPRERIIILKGFVVGIVILIAANLDKIITPLKLHLNKK